MMILFNSNMLYINVNFKTFIDINLKKKSTLQIKHIAYTY